MKFVTSKDIEAPQDHVFRALSDFTAFERQALRQGIDIIRTGQDAQAGPNIAWQVKFTYRNRPWAIDAGVAAFDPPSGYQITGAGNGTAFSATVDLMSLSRSITRLTFTIDLVPQTMAMRLVVQSLRLMQGNLQARLDKRIARLAGDVEARWRARS